MSKLSTVVAQGKGVTVQKAFDLFDKVLLFDGESNRAAVFACQEILGIFRSPHFHGHPIELFQCSILVLVKSPLLAKLLSVSSSQPEASTHQPGTEPEDFMGKKKFDPRRDYPLASQRPDLVKTISGLDFSEITLENVSSGKITDQEIRINSKTLEYQARIAEAHGRFQLATNFRRAAELTRVSDEEVLRIYNALRPHQATKEDLLAIAEDIEKKYKAKINARFIREAIGIYEKRDLLKKGQRAGEDHGTIQAI